MYTTLLGNIQILLNLIRGTIQKIMFRAECVRQRSQQCGHYTRHYFSLSGLFDHSHRRGCWRVLEFCMGFKFTKILGFQPQKKNCVPPMATWGRIFRFLFYEKCLELPEMARTLIRLWPACLIKIQFRAKNVYICEFKLDSSFADVASEAVTWYHSWY